MDLVQIHLALNHAPIFATLFAAGLILFGLARKNITVRKTGQWFLVLAALFAAPVFLTGEPAEDVVENKPGVTKPLIHDHEDSGKWALTIAGVVGTASLVALVLEQIGRTIPSPIFRVLLVSAFFSLGVFLRTAHLGGLIRHDELRSATEVDPAKIEEEKVPEIFD